MNLGNNHISQSLKAEITEQQWKVPKLTGLKIEGLLTLETTKQPPKVLLVTRVV